MRSPCVFSSLFYFIYKAYWLNAVSISLLFDILFYVLDESLSEKYALWLISKTFKTSAVIFRTETNIIIKAFCCFIFWWFIAVFGFVFLFIHNRYSLCVLCYSELKFSGFGQSFPIVQKTGKLTTNTYGLMCGIGSMNTKKCSIRYSSQLAPEYPSPV